MNQTPLVKGVEPVKKSKFVIVRMQISLKDNAWLPTLFKKPISVL